MTVTNNEREGQPSREGGEKRTSTHRIAPDGVLEVENQS